MTTKLRVELLDHTPNPEQLVACAAKLCYSAVGVEGIKEGLNEEKTSKFINMLMDLDHQSPIEHVSFTFAVEGVSRALTHQLVRHRMASYSQQSQRYVKLHQFEYVIPPEIDQIPKAKEIYIEAMEQDQRAYDKLVDILFTTHYNALIGEGIKEKPAKLQAEKKAIEDARYVFPNACETKVVFTMNARSLYNFFKHRCCNRAQWEIRMMAWEMLNQVKKAAPNLFKKVGPSCIDNPCPEGKMTCGEIVEVREKYRNIK
jgi:thymidylate synthase (FAD)